MSSSGKGQAGLVLGSRLTGAGSACMASPRPMNSTSPPAPPASPTKPWRSAGTRPAHHRGRDQSTTRILSARATAFRAKPDRGDQAFARTEGVILDPIYTGKAAAGMIAHIREGRYGPDDTLVFVHTGGTPSIFTWNILALKGLIMNRRDLRSRAGRPRPLRGIARRDTRRRRLTYGQSTGVVTLDPAFTAPTRSTLAAARPRCASTTAC